MDRFLITDFFELKKNLRKDYPALMNVKAAVLFDSSSQFFHQALKGYGLQSGINYSIYESDYNQIEKEVFTPSSGLYNSSPEFVIIGYSTQKLYQKFFKLDINAKVDFSGSIMNNISDLYEKINSQIKTNIIFFNFTEGLPAVFGNYSNKVKESFLYQVRKLNFDLMNFAADKSNFFIADINLLQHIHGDDFLFDSKLYTNSDIVFSLKILPYIAKNITDIVTAFKGKSKKCIILDLDNTLWGGVIGDDGIENIQIGSLGIGKAFSNLQMWVKQLKERGIILVVCSKNNEEIAKEPFVSHPDMILKPDDFAMFVANWKNKNENISFIQQTLNIGFDSMVFIDDNPLEREIIKTQFPDITVPELPEDPAEYVRYLNKLNLFETVSFTGEDLIRTKQYQEETGRVILKQNFLDENEFLKNLNMQAEISDFNKFNFPRVTQLFTRTNQFNLRTVRYSSAELENAASSGEYICKAFSLKDKFGEYGLVSAIILKKNTEHLFIENWVMSCRVFNRGLENFIFKYILKVTGDAGLCRLAGEYIPTPKNKVVENLLNNLGFKNSDENMWEIDIKSAPTVIHFINGLPDE